MAKSYQYLTITGRWATIDKETSKLGKEGWRLADVAVGKSRKKSGREYLVVTMEKAKPASLSTRRGWRK